MTDSSDDLRIADNPAENRYEAVLNGQIVGVSEYDLAGDRIVFVHTEVDPSVEGMGIGSRLAKGALDDVRQRGLKLVADCPFIAAWLKRHRDYGDLVAD
jgi:predicted GNAT family acetyltransferase